MEQFYAHIAEDGRTQTVTEHLRGSANRASNCLVDVGLGKSAFLAGLLHDVGKYTAAFQSYLREGDRSKRGSVIHTFQGCRYLLEQAENWTGDDATTAVYTAELLAYAVGAHHGQFDCVNELGKSGMQYRREKEDTFYSEAIANFYVQGNTSEEIRALFTQAMHEIDNILSRIELTYETNEAYCFEVGLLARLLLSAVIEGDRFNTAAFARNIAAPERDADMQSLWDDRLRFMEEKISQLPSDTSVNKARFAISDRCRAFAAKPTGIYRLCVPTGGGKTLSALRYALAHAKQYNKKRLLFISPLLSILEQNATVIRKYIGNDDMILEHHSNVVQTERNKEKLDERELLVQNWDTPIIITTLVQFLNCLFDGKTTSIRRFQALSNSVIVIDEVQTVPTKLLSLFNLAIRFLAEQCGATVVLCSATQPYLEGADQPLLPPPEDIVPYDPAIWDAFVRTQIWPMGSVRLEQLPDIIRTFMEETDSLLVICNRKDEAEFLFNQTKSMDYYSYHLSASMCMQHRRDTVASVEKSLQRGEKTLCVSTQVIEAGVDISFRRVLRLTAGMDSVVQSAGRCNRNGESNTPCPVYVVNCTDESLGKLKDIQRGKTATISLLHSFSDSPDRFGNDLASDASIRYYYQQFYSDMSKGAQDYPLPKLQTTILDLNSENRKYVAKGGLELERLALRQAFKTAGDAFSVFEENTTDVIAPYGAGEHLISELCSDRCKMDAAYRASLLKQATAYTVSLYDYQRKQLGEKGALAQICDGYALALQGDYYDGHIGLKRDTTRLSFWEV